MKQLINTLLVLAFLMPVSALADTVRCESKNDALKECEMNTRGGVRKVKQLSRADCVEGVNWGVNRHSVWVKNGCRAEFESGGGGSSANVGREWDRGCGDAKVGSYDRSRHSDAYEEGWQACKNQNKPSGNAGREWDRGCGDARVGSYDRSRHSQAYEDGWQACKNQNKPSGSVDKEWARGCEDAKNDYYQKSDKHGQAYEDGWRACKKSSGQQNKPSGSVNKEWARGCEDAKNDYYQKSDKHGQDYEDGWRACKKQYKIEHP
jgi:hypothetical protein